MTGRRAGLLLCGAALLGACRTSRTYIPRPTVYDALGEAASEAARTPRVLADAGRLAEAHAALAELCRAEPRNLRLSTFLQELELGLLARGESVRGLAPGEAETPPALLFPVYLRRAQQVPTSEAFVLAARLAPDEARRAALLDEALRIDPRNPWAHYGRAWALARAERFDEAREALEHVFAIDPGHLPAMRLDGALEARAGKTRRAILAFESWLERSVADPTVAPEERATVRLDLAILYVLDARPARALAALEGVEVRDPARGAQAELVRAAAFHALGRPEDAARAARLARELAPDELLAPVDRALLAHARRDPEAERAAWAEALAIAEEGRAGAGSTPDSSDFRRLLIHLQALTRLARLGEPAP